MASLQERNSSYRILFCTTARRAHLHLGEVAETKPRTKPAQVDYLLMRLKQRLLVLPDGTDIVTFIQHDGKPPDAGPTLANCPAQAVTVAQLKERYLATHGNGTIEANSLDTCKLHLGHFCRVPRRRLPRWPNCRSPSSRSTSTSGPRTRWRPSTIRKEIATLRAAWNWGEPMGLTAGRFPNRGLRYPKADEKPPFMTMAEIERQIAGGADADVALGGALPDRDEADRVAGPRQGDRPLTRGFTRCSASPPTPGPGGARSCGRW